MKTRILLSLLFAGSALVAKAGNEGAAGAPMPLPPPVLAEYITSGGFFVPPGGVASKRYQILKDGVAQLVTWVRGAQQPKTRQLKMLSSAELVYLKKLVKAVRPGDVVDPNPDSPGCMDAPSFRYVVYSKVGEITIDEKMNCKHMTRPNATKSDAAVISILADIKALADQPARAPSPA